MDLPKHILYIEDNVDSQRLVNRLLKAPEYKLEIVSDGIEALRRLETRRPDLILVDIGLPEMDGKNVTKLIRQKDEFHNTPVVAITAHALNTDKESIMASGCTGYITKPINVDSFQEEIQNFL